MSGEVDFQEREGRGPWQHHRLRKGSFFLTSGGAPYDCRWRAVGAEPFETMSVFIELPLLQRALAEVFGAGAAQARLRDLSAFTDPALDGLMERLRDELMRQQASPLLVQGLGQAIAVHLARHYAVSGIGAPAASAALPAHKLRQLTDWMAAHAAEEFDLGQLAARAGLCIAEAEVRARVTFGRDPVDGLYALAAHIDIHLPGLDRAVAEALVRNAERHCPYAKMARQGIESVVAPTQQVRRLMSAPAAGCPGSAGPARGCARSCSR